MYNDISLSTSELYQTNVIQTKSKHGFYVISFFFENRAVYETTWKSTAERGRAQVALWGAWRVARVLCIACWVPTAVHTHTHTHTRTTHSRNI